MSSLALARRNSKNNFKSLYPEVTMRSTIDEKLRRNLVEMEKNREQMEKLDEYIRVTLKFPSGKKRDWLVRMFKSILPNWFYEKLPDIMVQHIAEEQTVLDLIEMRFRANVINAQETALNQKEVTKEMAIQVAKIREDIEQAKNYNWDARKLHDYSLALTGIEIEPEISELLDSKFNILTPEEKENRRQALLRELEDTAVAGDKWVRLGATGCYACLEQFETLGIAFGRYILFQKPAAAFRDTARALAGADNVMHQSRDAIEATVRVSISVIENSLENIRTVSNYSLTSVDMVRLLETGNEKIDNKLKAIEADRRKSTLTLAAPLTVRELRSSDVIDVQPAS